MAQATFNPMHQLSVLNVRRCGRYVAHLLLKSATVPHYRLAGLPMLRRLHAQPVQASRRGLTERYVRCNTPSRLLGWR